MMRFCLTVLWEQIKTRSSFQITHLGYFYIRKTCNFERKREGNEPLLDESF